MLCPASDLTVDRFQRATSPCPLKEAHPQSPALGWPPRSWGPIAQQGWVTCWGMGARKAGLLAVSFLRRAAEPARRGGICPGEEALPWGLQPHCARAAHPAAAQAWPPHTDPPSCLCCSSRLPFLPTRPGGCLSALSAIPGIYFHFPIPFWPLSPTLGSFTYRAPSRPLSWGHLPTRLFTLPMANSVEAEDRPRPFSSLSPGLLTLSLAGLCAVVTWSGHEMPLAEPAWGLGA